MSIGAPWGMAEKKDSIAARPPAEAPMPTMGKPVFACFVFDPGSGMPGFTIFSDLTGGKRCFFFFHVVNIAIVRRSGSYYLLKLKRVITRYKQSRDRSLFYEDIAGFIEIRTKYSRK